MKRKSNLAQVPTPQLELPFGQQDGQQAAHDLAYYIGLGKVFAAYHKRWPTVESTREEFRAARVPDYDGQRIDRELRFPSPALEADPAYQALRERALADDSANDSADGLVDGISLAALDPRYRTVLREEAIAALFDTIVLPRAGDPAEVRYASGLPAHRPGELSLHSGDAIRARALALAGLDPDDARVLAAGFALRVQANDELKQFIDRVGARHPAASERLADDYLLDAGDEGRLFLKFQLLSGRRYAGKFDVARLARKLAEVYGADPVLAGLRGAALPEAAPVPASAPAPAPDSDAELREQLAMLEADGQGLALPIQQLSRFDDIRRALEGAGAVFSRHRQRFDFEDGIDPALVVEQLLSGGATTRGA